MLCIRHSLSIPSTILGSIIFTQTSFFNLNYEKIQLLSQLLLQVVYYCLPYSYKPTCLLLLL